MRRVFSIVAIQLPRVKYRVRRHAAGVRVPQAAPSANTCCVAQDWAGIAVESIAMTESNSADVILWLLARGYGISETGGALLVVREGSHDTLVVRPRDILVRDPLTGRLLTT